MARRFLKLKGGRGGCGQHGMRVPPEKFDLASRGPLPRGQPVVVNTHGGLTLGGDAQEQSIKTVS